MVKDRDEARFGHGGGEGFAAEDDLSFAGWSQFLMPCHDTPDVTARATLIF
jgi:hypothetical protein